MRDPIIFVGMHRSGTSLLGRLLEELGLFVGVKKDQNNEAIFFQRLNDWLLQQSGATWDRPSGIEDLWKVEPALPWTESYIKTLCASPRAVEFLGVRRFLAGGMKSLQEPWGWKDPRNTFTLPMWLRIFPGAKVVYIERHGVDVAQSLRVRALKGLQDSVEKYKRYRPLVFLRPKLAGFADSPRCVSLEGGFALWSEYVDQARSVLTGLPEERVLRLRYEELLENPANHVRVSAEFCGLKASPSDLQRVITAVQAEKARSYLNDAELSEFATRHRDQLRQRGYAE